VLYTFATGVVATSGTNRPVFCFTQQRVVRRQHLDVLKRDALLRASVLFRQISSQSIF
jgi:hypothetical protein